MWSRTLTFLRDEGTDADYQVLAAVHEQAHLPRIARRSRGLRCAACRMDRDPHRETTHAGHRVVVKAPPQADRRHGVLQDRAGGLRHVPSQVFHA